MRFTVASVGVLPMLLATIIATGASAQNNAVPPANSIHIAAGDMLEIGMEATSPRSDFSWILTRDRKFQNAQRTRFFGLRPAQAGVYVLDVSVQDPLLSQNDYRAFNIVVSEPNPLPPPIRNADGPVKAVLKTVPATINGTVYLQPDEGAIIALSGMESTGKITSYGFDFDNTIDSNGDGNPENDRDNQDTFSEKSGSPLTYFMTKKPMSSTISMTVTDAVTGQTDKATVNVVFGTAPSAPADQPTGDINSPILMTVSGMTARFEAKLPQELVAGKEILQEWDFGDRSRSLLTNPLHSYGAAGTFTVALTVRDIQTAQIIYTGTNAVTVQQSAIASSANGSQSSAMSSSVAASENAKSGSFGSIVKVLMIILMILGIAIGLYVLFVWIKRKTGGHLEKAIESIEKNIVKSEKKEEGKIEPLKIKKETVMAPPSAKSSDNIIDVENAKTEFQSKTRENIVPIASSAPVPSWLSKASNSPAPTPGSAANLVVATPAPTPAAITSSASSITPTPTAKPTQNSAPTAPLPDWLKQTPKSAEPAAAAKPQPIAPTPVIAPVQTPAPKAAVSTPTMQPVEPKPLTNPIAVNTSPTVQPIVVPPAAVPSAEKPVTPSPALNPIASVTSKPVSTPAPVTTPKPTAAPIAPTSAPAAVKPTTPAPQSPSPAASQAEKTPAPVAAKPIVNPKPAPVTAKQSAPTPPTAPKTATAEAKSRPQPTPALGKKPALMQDIPKATLKQEPKKESPKIDDDQPIAFIQADSLTK